MEAQTAGGDVPLDFAKRSGNPNSFLKAGRCEIIKVALSHLKASECLVIHTYTVCTYIAPGPGVPQTCPGFANSPNWEYFTPIFFN